MRCLRRFGRYQRRSNQWTGIHIASSPRHEMPGANTGCARDEIRRGKKMRENGGGRRVVVEMERRSTVR